MDIVQKQKNKISLNNPQSGSHPHKHSTTNTWTGAYPRTNANAKKIQTLNKYLKSDQPTIARSQLIATSSTNRGKTVFWFSLVLFILAILFASGFFIYKTNNTINQITDNDHKHSFAKMITSFANPESYKVLNGFHDGRINILLLGRANSHKSGKDLTDTIMLLSINTIDYTVGLFSIPRDFLIRNRGYYVKINSLYQTGLRTNVGAKYITDAVEKITNQTIQYYFVLDFEGFKKIINLLGGININVPNHIKDERYPGPGYSYETFEVYPGLQEFDGATALKYARTRHDVDGDFGRAARQQQVMQSARNKAFSLGTIVNPIKINEIFNVLSDHVHTNILPNEIEPFISLVKKLNTHNITNVVIDAWKPGSLLISARYYSERGGISGLVPRSGNYTEIQEFAENIFDLTKMNKRREEINKESPTILIVVNRAKSKLVLPRIKKTLSSLGFNDITTKFTNNLPIDTTVIDTTKKTKPFSLDELLKKLPATLEPQLTTFTYTKNNHDFVIMLGNDIMDMHTYTEISREELETEDNTIN